MVIPVLLGTFRRVPKTDHNHTRNLSRHYQRHTWMCQRSRFLLMPLQQLRMINSLQHLPTLTRIKCKSLGLIKRRQLWLMKVNLIWLTRTCHGSAHFSNSLQVTCNHRAASTASRWGTLNRNGQAWNAYHPTDHGSCQSRPDTSAHSWPVIIRYRQENPVDMARWVWGKTIILCYTDGRSAHRNGNVEVNWWLAWWEWLDVCDDFSQCYKWWGHQVTAAALFIFLHRSYADYQLNTPEDEQRHYDEWCKQIAAEHLQFDYWFKVWQLEILYLQFMRWQRQQQVLPYLQSLGKIIPRCWPLPLCSLDDSSCTISACPWG